MPEGIDHGAGTVEILVDGIRPVNVGGEQALELVPVSVFDLVEDSADGWLHVGHCKTNLAGRDVSQHERNGDRSIGNRGESDTGALPVGSTHGS